MNERMDESLGLYQYKDKIGIPIIKIRRYNRRLIFITRSHVLEEAVLILKPGHGALFINMD